MKIQICLKIMHCPESTEVFGITSFTRDKYICIRNCNTNLLLKACSYQRRYNAIRLYNNIVEFVCYTQSHHTDDDAIQVGGS